MQPFIIDTDLGSDIDDVWALVYVLLSGVPISLIVVSHRNTAEKGALVAKILTLLERTEIPIAIGPATSQEATRLHTWFSGFSLANYTGPVHHDLTILEHTIASGPYTILGLSPATSLATLPPTTDLSQTTLIQMAGSINVGYDGAPTPAPEWNVKQDIPAFRNILSRNWQRLILVPLDASGLILSGRDFEAIATSTKPAAKLIMECYRNWSSQWSRLSEGRSSVLFDLVTAHAAQNLPKLQTTKLKLEVTDSGHTKPSAQGSPAELLLAYPTSAVTPQLLHLLGL